MTSAGRRATLFNLAANAFLFVIKLVGYSLTGSLALMSDAINSFSDSVYSVAIFMAVRLSHKQADHDHPFGHHRAEPVASLLIALLAGILGFEIIKIAAESLISPEPRAFSMIAIAILLVTIGLKSAMWLYFRGVAKRIRSPALDATSIDCRNDILVSAVAMLGVFSLQMGILNIDSYAAIFIGIIILRSGYTIGTQNMDYLMGKSPPKDILEEIQRRAKSVKGTRGAHDIKAHYVGNYLHVQVHLEVDKDMTTQKSHDLGEKVEKLIEEMPAVDKAFVHIDPR
jgi:cation diffusion facilitator family transporter